MRGLAIFRRSYCLIFSPHCERTAYSRVSLSLDRSPRHPFCFFSRLMDSALEELIAAITASFKQVCTYGKRHHPDSWILHNPLPNCVYTLNSNLGKSRGKKHWQPKPTSSAPHASGEDVTHGPSSHSSQLAWRQTEPLRNLPSEAELSETLRSTHPYQGAEPSGAPISSQKVSSTGDRKGRAVAGGNGLLESEQLHVVTNDKLTMPDQEKGTKLRKEEIVAPKKLKGSVAKAQLRATFYPKFENEKSDQEVRLSMHEVVGAGHGVLEVTQKHSGSLFLYSGDNGGAFAKNSYGNLYTAVGVFVLGRTLQEAWGPQADQKQREFNAYLKDKRICVGMELVTAVLGDHGQRPLQDYVVVTAVTELDGRPHFQSTPDVVAFCHHWRLPTNQYWLFSSRKTVSSFFAAYDALCEEGLARTVTNSLNEIADLSLPGTPDIIDILKSTFHNCVKGTVRLATKPHEVVQGEILEGLVTRVVTPQSVARLKEVLVKCPPPPPPQAPLKGRSLLEICSAHRESEKEQVKALLKAVGPALCSDQRDWVEDGVAEVEFSKRAHSLPMLESLVHSTPADLPTKKLQEIVHVIHESKLPVRFKCRMNMGGQNADQPDHISSQFKMTVHVLSDSAFQRYQKEMGKHSGLWPLYRGFFVDVQIFDGTSPPSVIDKRSSLSAGSVGDSRGDGECGQDDSVDQTENLMLKLKFLPYKIRTFLIRNGIEALFDKGVSDYKEYYTRQMKIWGTSPEKQRELNQLLQEWAGYIKKRMKGKRLSSNTYLTEAEPFLKQFAERSAKNQQLVGAAGVQIDVENFLAQVTRERRDGERDEYIPDEEQVIRPTRPLHAPSVKAQGMLVFFPGIPGCAKSALCKEMMTSPDGLGSGLVMHSLMGDMIKGKYWTKLKDERIKKPHRITFADKNAPTNDVWQTIKSMCKDTKAIGVPVIPESEGTAFNPYSLDVLAIFMYRVLQRTNHPGHLDKNSPNPGYVLLLFYDLFNGRDRKEFEQELLNQFGHLVRIPVLKDRSAPLLPAITEVIQDGLGLYERHTSQHGRLESRYGNFKEEWVLWEKRLKDVLVAHASYLDEVQVPFQEAVRSVQEQLEAIAGGDFSMHVPVDTEERSFQTFRFVAVALPPEQVLETLIDISANNSDIAALLSGTNLKELSGLAHITLAHKLSHGIAAVAGYGHLRGTSTQVQLTAALFSGKLCALEVRLIESGENAVRSKNSWPHLTVWAASGVPAKEANKLPQMVKAGVATRVEFKPVTLTGKVDFF